MKGSIGCPTKIITVIPHQCYIYKHEQKDLSKKAKHRLKIFDWYYQKSYKYSKNHKPNVSLTCRHFGISRSQFYRLKKRFDKHNLKSLENKSTAPKNKRQAKYDFWLVDKIKKIRKSHPTYSGKKIFWILKKAYPNKYIPSSATIGRIIRKYNMFYRADVNRHRKKHNNAMKYNNRKRKPYNLKATEPHRIIEFDMKHIYLLGTKQYALCAIDTVTREAVIHIASSSSSRVARDALKKVVDYFGKNITIVCDNGSENMKDAEQYLSEQHITQYWCKPYSPKQKPMIERFIGTFQKECIDYNYEPMNVQEMQKVADSFLEVYHHYRPHEALGFLTPAEYCATLKLSIPHYQVSHM